MDPLKKLVADSLGAQVAGQPHPDAELLAAFAENALSPMEREGVLEHLGTCGACREVLFLALPTSSDTQKVLAVPKPRPRFAIRWATAAACVVIAAAVFVGRHELTRKGPIAQKAQSAAAAAQQPAIVAMDKAPAEMDAIRESQAPAKSAPAAPKALPEAKHITAAPSVALDFRKSGQVVVEPAPRSDLKLEANAKDLPVNGRNVTELMKVTPGTATRPANTDMVADSGIKDLPIQGRDAGALLRQPAANVPAPGQNVGGPVPTENRNQYAYSAPAAFGSAAKQVAAAGVLGGTVVDPSGAVVANSKVTTVGPAGTKTITVGPDGKFSFDQLPPGQYSLKAAAPGFKTADLEQVAVLAGKPSDVRVMLNVGAVSETVEISAGALAVQTDAAETSQIEANQSVNGVVATTTESEAAANEKTDNGRLSRKKAAKARPAAAGGGLAGAGRGTPILQWTLSPEGAVQRSLDRGATWESISTPDQRSFRTLSAIGGDVWAGGNAGALYHSADSGQHWTRVVPEVNGEKLTADITRVSFNDLQNGTVSTANGQVWMTSNGGQSWQRK